MSAAGQALLGWPAVRRLAGRARTVTMLAVAALFLAAAILAATRATPAFAAACSGRRGVTVVVDFTKFHRGIKVGCDPGRPSTGLAALRGAGFSYTFVPRIPGFVCRINRLPRRCNGAPSTAYWSYWHARPHGKWMYSSVGAGSYHPRAGWVEGWAFGNGKPPRRSPP